MKQLTLSEIQSIGLPKWPGLRVKGNAVTPNQAAEIILRTDSGHFSCNDKEWEKTCLDCIGYKGKLSEWGTVADYDALQECFVAIGHLSLSYMTNSRIASCYIGGPFGWLNWNGVIGCNSFNIGKWPSTTEVLHDLQDIAATWPFLEMAVQLLDKESCEDDPSPVIEFHVSEGTVKAFKPEGLLEVEDSGATYSDFLFDRNERGCTEAKLRQAVSLAKKAAGK